MKLELIISIFLLGLSIRTFAYHLRSWQIREYRWDRMQSWLKTHDGLQNIFSLWFFKGVFPRPQISFRIILIALITLSILAIKITTTVYLITHYEFFQQNFGWWDSLALPWKILIYERILFLYTFLGIVISKVPVQIYEKKLYKKAKQIIAAAPNITRIGITGSYGKTTTKEILVHLLQNAFGKENVIFSPKNENNEIALARLIISHEKFFKTTQNADAPKKFLVAEVGAYKKGEIKKVCTFLQPQVGILTGISDQHLDLFGSQEKIIHSKFELAEAAQQKVFFNADSDFLSEIFADKKVQATPIGLSAQSIIKNVRINSGKTLFELHQVPISLPMQGIFFAQNALLCIEYLRELGISIEKIAKALALMPKNSRAMDLKTHSQKKYTIINNTYSANSVGAFAAVEKLKKTSGEKVFIGIPLRELGKNSKKIHTELFKKLADQQAKVFWWKSDFSALGKKICGKNFCGKNKTKLKSTLSSLKINDTVLILSRVPKTIIQQVEG